MESNQIGALIGFATCLAVFFYGLWLNRKRKQDKKHNHS